jgi:SAM-dependent methyltransferase
MRALVGLITALLLSEVAGHVATSNDQTLAHSSRTAPIPLSDVGNVIAAIRPKVPPQLTASGSVNLDVAWAKWVTEHDDRLRERLDRGDEDSAVNLWMYGTSFTRLRPARARDVSPGEPDTLDGVLAGRLDDLLTALASPRPTERIVFVRRFLERHGIDATTRRGQDATRRLLTSARLRAREEFARTDAVLSSARRRGDAAAGLEAASTIFQDRGLSSDTSLLVDVAIDRALHALRSGGLLSASSVRRVAIVGPGLDFINKADGQDFYPQQTIQPFAIVNSLLRHGLAAPRDLQVTTVDVSARVTQHLSDARVRARIGETYLLHLPLPRTETWTTEVRTFWREFGDRIGADAPPMPVPDTDDADVRAIRIRPDVVSIVDPVQADIVTSRLVVSDDDRFDLVIATNVFVYYAAFEQALAAANVAAMLRPGGILLSNNDLPVIAPMKSSVGYLRVKYSDRQNDQIFSYQRQ